MTPKSTKRGGFASPVQKPKMAKFIFGETFVQGIPIDENEFNIKQAALLKAKKLQLMQKLR